MQRARCSACLTMQPEENSKNFLSFAIVLVHPQKLRTVRSVSVRSKWQVWRSQEDLFSTPKMTGKGSTVQQKRSCATPGKPKAPFATRPIKHKEGDARGAHKVRRHGASSIHFYCAVPRSSSHLEAQQRYFSCRACSDGIAKLFRACLNGVSHSCRAIRSKILYRTDVPV